MDVDVVAVDVAVEVKVEVEVTYKTGWLVVEPTPLKNMLVKLDYFPKFRDENKK